MQIDEPAIDRIAGAIFGHAIGDAFGLPHEHTPGRQKWPDSTSWFGFPANDWSEKTDHLVLAIRAMSKVKPATPRTCAHELADELTAWAQQGMPEFDDKKCIGAGGYVGAVMADPNFLTTPADAADAVWKKSGGLACTNSALCRSVPAAALPRVEVIDVARVLTRTTHADPRAISACVIHALILHDLIFSAPTDPVNYDAILAAACRDATDGLPDECIKAVSAAVKLGYTGSMADLDLNGDRSEDALKCLSAGMYALHALKIADAAGTTLSFCKVIERVAAEGGSASANCALAGSILGARLGIKRLPDKMIFPMPYRDRLGDVVEEFVVRLVGGAEKDAPVNPPGK